MNEIAERLVKRHEGLRLKPYRCTGGKASIGWGRNLDDNGIRPDEAALMLRNDIEQATQEAKGLAYFNALDDVRQAVIIDMLFNLGLPRFLGFERMNIALERHNYAVAAVEMLDSRWAGQVGERAERLSQMMKTGVEV
ncbi:glycoside hydrolase family protein [Vibrio furnissii]|uniref:glycoside hydrolase family protein n=1 Tax=Vibrio furnissii TaxID=29494 RepID=UPI0015592BA4|nr:lysozyme [Vibrio furnissii]